MSRTIFSHNPADPLRKLCASPWKARPADSVTGLAPAKGVA